MFLQIVLSLLFFGLVFLSLISLQQLLKLIFKKKFRTRPSVYLIREPLYFLYGVIALSFTKQHALPHVYYKFADTVIRVGLVIAAVCIGVRLLSHLAFKLYGRRRHVQITSPQILESIFNKIIYGIAFLFYLHFAYQYDLGDLVVTTALILGLLAFLFQKPLTTFLAGISLCMERNFEVGDEIEVAGYRGKVLDGTWKRILLLTAQNNLAIIPMKLVVENVITNYSRPNENMTMIVEFQVPEIYPPAQIIELLRQCLNDIGDHTSPIACAIHLQKITHGLITYSATLTISDFTRQEEILSRCHLLWWYKFNRYLTQIQERNMDTQARQRGIETIRKRIQAIELFKSLSTQEVTYLAANSKLESYGPGEKIVGKDDSGNSLYIVDRGMAEVEFDQYAPRLQITEGGFFGEASLLLGQNRNATVVAATETKLIEVTQQALKQILKDNTKLVESLTETMVSRQKEREEKLRHLATKQQDKELYSWTLEAIKAFFEL